MISRAFVLTAVLVAGACSGSGDGDPQSEARAAGSGEHGGAARAAGSGEHGGAARAAGSEPEAALIATADDQGSFNTPCGYTYSRPDDPIVHAGHEGVSHSHDFFGAVGVTAESTTESLLAGETTCRSVADRSAYWAPSLLAGGQPLQPTEMLAYYRVPIGADATQVEPPPNGLEMIAGDSEATTPQPAETVAWRCGFNPETSAIPVHCPSGMDLRLQLHFDPCWNGEDLASDDHRSHLAPLGGDGACPSSHPVLIPQLLVEIRYPTGDAVGELSLASGPLTGGHGDAVMAWDAEHIAGEVEVCLNRNRQCDVVSETSRLGFDQLG